MSQQAEDESRCPQAIWDHMVERDGSCRWCGSIVDEPFSFEEEYNDKSFEATTQYYWDYNTYLDGR